MFYVLDGTIYQSPDFLDLIRTRCLNVGDHLSSAFLGMLSTVVYSAERGNCCWSDSTEAIGAKPITGTQVQSDAFFPDMSWKLKDIEAFSKES